MEKIVFLEVESWEEPMLKQAFPAHTVILKEGNLESEIDPEIYNATILCVFTFTQLQKETLEKFPHLKLIVTRSTGYDHIDINYCKEKGIIVSNVPAYGVHTIAEHTFALLLAITRKIIPSVERTKRGNFSLDGLRGMELFGKTIGVIGAGNIGSVVVDIAKGFGLKVLIYSRHAKESSDPQVSYVTDLNTILGQSDVITIHVPSTPETKHLISLENLSKIKKGAILLNAARGAIVQTEAILQGLETGILSGAGLDVLEEECELREEKELLTTTYLQTCDIRTQLMNHVLLYRDDVIITPHNAFNSEESIMQILHLTIEDIQTFLNGTPQNVVTLPIQS